MKRWIAVGATVLLATGCGEVGEPEPSFAQAADGAGAAATVADAPLDVRCEVVETGIELPDAVRETSGLAQGRRDSGVLWTHNDAGNDATLHAIDAGGGARGTVAVPGVDAVDWEDVEIAPCGSGDCLFIADTGDNDGDREGVVVYRVEEPEAGGASTGAPTALRARYPDGAWDSEALFVLPGSDAVYLVTKGRRGPIALYRRNAGDGVVELERVRELAPEPEAGADRVTAATASPDGRWVGILTARALHLYPADALVGGGQVSPVRIDLAALGHPQSEAVSIAADGTVRITTEAENRDARPLMSTLRCAFPG